MTITKSNVVQGKQHIPMLVAESEIEYTEYVSLNKPENIVKIINDVFHLEARAEEYLYMLALTSACEQFPYLKFPMAHITCLLPEEGK